jgi:hypothetical protein
VRLVRAVLLSLAVVIGLIVGAVDRAGSAATAAAAGATGCSAPQDAEPASRTGDPVHAVRRIPPAKLRANLADNPTAGHAVAIAVDGCIARQARLGTGSARAAPPSLRKGAPAEFAPRLSIGPPLSV